MFYQTDTVTSVYSYLHHTHTRLNSHWIASVRCPLLTFSHLNLSPPTYLPPVLNIRWQINLQRMPWTVRNWRQQSEGRLHTHRLFAGVGSGAGRGVFHMYRHLAAGGQFDFERCVGSIQTGVFKTVVRYRQVQVRVQVPMLLHWDWQAGR